MPGFFIFLLKKFKRYLQNHFVDSTYGFYRKVQAYIFINNIKKRMSIKVHLWRNFLTKCFVAYLFFFSNVFAFNPNNYLLFIGDITTIKGFVLTLLTASNIDNWILYLYVCHHITGFWFSFLFATDTNLLLHYSFLNLYNTYKIKQPFFLYTVSSAISTIKFTIITSIEMFYTSPYFVNFTTPSSLVTFFALLLFTSVLFSWLFFSFLGIYGVFYLNIFTLFCFWLSLSFLAQTVLVEHNVFIIKLCSWVFLSCNTKIDYYFLLDTISFSFAWLTTSIAFFVFIYAFSYFRYEPLVDRFLLFLLSFVISMLFLILSGNTVMLFLGWELIGFTSFCLINFWTTRTGTLKSAFKAFTFNKVSDFFMFMFLIVTYSIYYTFDIFSINLQTYSYKFLMVQVFGIRVYITEFISLLLLGAAFVKSAQFGGHMWLPDSMEAPVPASSLIHSATLVSAGIYLILRFNHIFDSTIYAKLIIPLLGSITAAYGGVCAMAQSDIKKTLAYSTISHCGFLMVLCATEMNEFTVLYLYIHGFFKAGVFMCVGNVLRIMSGYQDTRRMGGLVKYLPFEYFLTSVGLLNLAGLPFTFGFFIKHLLLLSLDNHIYLFYFILFNSLIGAFSGLFYSYRLLTYTFTDFKKANKLTYTITSKSSLNSIFFTNTSKASTLTILCLFLSSYIIAYNMFNFFIFGNNQFSDYLNITILSNYYSVINSHYGFLLNFSFINTTVLFIICGFFFSCFRKFEKYHNNIFLGTSLFLCMLYALLF